MIKGSKWVGQLKAGKFDQNFLKQICNKIKAANTWKPCQKALLQTLLYFAYNLFVTIFCVLFTT